MADKDVIAEPVLRLRAESASLKSDLEKAKAAVKNATSEIARDAAKALVDGLEKKLSGVGAALSKAERAAAKEVRAIQAQIDRLNATKATASVATLEKAVDRMGGTSKLSAQQVSILTAQVDRLAAAGAKIPKSLVMPKVGGGGGLAGGANAALQSAAAGLSPGGALGAGLASIGPAGLTAAAGIGAIALAAAGAGKAVEDFVERGSKIQDLKDKTGLSTDALQAFGFVAAQAGISVEDVAGSSLKLSKTIGEAELGSKKANAALAALGLTVRDLQGLSPEEQFAKVAAALRQIPEEEQQIALGSALMGKGFASVAALVRTDLTAAFEQARRSGTFLSEAQVKAADEFGDAMGRLGMTFEALKVQLGAAILSSLGGGDAARGVDAIANAAAGLVAVVQDPKFQAFINFVTLGAAGMAGKIVQNLAKEGQFKNLPIKSDKQIAEDSKVTGPDLFTSLSQDEGLRAAAKEAAEERRKAQADAEAYRRELERLAEEEKRGAIEANKRWSDEQAAVEKVNAAVAKRVSDAKVSVFGTSPEAAREAAQSFDILAKALGAQIELLGDGEVAYNGLSKAISGLSEGELTKLEAQLVKMEQATRDDAEANAILVRYLGEVRAALRANGQGFEEIKPKVVAAKDETLRFADALGIVGMALSKMGAADLGGLISQLGSLVKQSRALADAMNRKGPDGKPIGWSGLSSGQKWQAGADIAGGAMEIATSAYSGASVNTGKSVAKGAISGAAKGAVIGATFGGVGAAVGAVAGAVIGGVAAYMGSKKKIKEALAGFDKQLIEQFGSIKAARAEADKYGIALGKALDSKKVKDIAAAMDALNKKLAERANLEQGLTTAQANVEALQDQAKAIENNPALAGAVAALAQKVQDELLKAGMGYAAAGPLRDSERYAGARGIAGAAAGTVAGLRQAGVVDKGVLDAAGTIAAEVQKEAFAAAKEAGLDDAAATKASFGAVSGLLKEQLNAELQSTGKISAALQAQLDEAKKNGIEILADPAIAQLAVSREQLAELKRLNGGKPGERGAAAGATGGAAAGEPRERLPGFARGGIIDAGRGRPVMLHGLEAVIPLRNIQPSPSMGFQAGPNGASASFGGGPGARPAPSVTVAPTYTVTVNGSQLSQPELSAAMSDAFRRRDTELLFQAQRALAGIR